MGNKAAPPDLVLCTWPEVEEYLRGSKGIIVPSGSVEQHSLTDQIEADRYLASKAASKRPDRGLRMSRIAPPGAGEMA